MCELIQARRNQLGISGFAKHLMRLEGRLMDTVQYQLIDLGIPAIRLHDGMLVGASHVETTKRVIAKLGKKLFGITPSTKQK